MTLYAITATLVHHTTDNVCVSVDLTQQIPTFLLSGEMHGIVNEQHAEEIARKIICPIDLQYESVTVTVQATKVQ